MNDFDPAGMNDDYKDNETCAKRVMPALFAWFLLISASSTYFTLVFPEFYALIGPSPVYFLSVAAAHGAIFLFVIINFVISTFMDPGRFPKVDVNEVIDEFKQNSGTYKNVLINDVNVRMKWCTTCQFFRPPRSSHCGVCNACIDTMDHHCPWICNCIARRNYKYFLQFLISLSVHMMIILGFSIALVFTHKTNLTQLPIIVAVFMIIVVGILIIPIGGLTGFHIILVSRGRTTNEQVTGKFRTGVNPFDMGFCANWARTLCLSASPSYMHFVSEKRKRIEYMETMMALEAAKSKPKVKHKSEMKRPIDYDNYDDLDTEGVLNDHRNRNHRSAKPYVPAETNKIKYNGNNLLSSSSAVILSSARDDDEDQMGDESVHMLRHTNESSTHSSNKKPSKSSKKSKSRANGTHEQYEMHDTPNQDQYYEEREQQPLENGQSVWVNRDTLKAKKRSSSSNGNANGKKHQLNNYDESNSVAMAYTDVPNFSELPPKTDFQQQQHSNRNKNQPPSSKKYSALNGNGHANRDKQLTNKLLMQENLNNNNQFIRNNSYVKANYTANVDSYYDKQISLPVQYQPSASFENNEDEKRISSSSKKSSKSRVSQGQINSQHTGTMNGGTASRSTSKSHKSQRDRSQPRIEESNHHHRLNSMSDDQSGTTPDYASYEITV